MHFSSTFCTCALHRYYCCGPACVRVPALKVHLPLGWGPCGSCRCVRVRNRPAWPVLGWSPGCSPASDLGGWCSWSGGRLVRTLTAALSPVNKDSSRLSLLNMFGGHLGWSNAKATSRENIWLCICSSGQHWSRRSAGSAGFVFSMWNQQL